MRGGLDRDEDVDDQPELDAAADELVGGVVAEATGLVEEHVALVVAELEVLAHVRDGAGGRRRWGRGIEVDAPQRRDLAQAAEGAAIAGGREVRALDDGLLELGEAATAGELAVNEAGAKQAQAGPVGIAQVAAQEHRIRGRAEHAAGWTRRWHRGSRSR